MQFTSYLKLSEFLVGKGATRGLFKQLSENDNSKQQVYIGGSFEALNQIPFGKIRLDKEPSTPNFKAPLDFCWIDDDGNVSAAKTAQLILYPKYPEVRLSGFLKGSPTSPSKAMQPVAKARRTGADGRVLVLGIGPGGRIYAYLGVPGSPVVTSMRTDGLLKDERDVFAEFPLDVPGGDRANLLAALHNIVHGGWHTSCRLTADRGVIEYRAQNGGGYTLEALLGIVTNAIAGPDLLGWEVKGFSSTRITLMTSEPDGGYYAENGVGAFLREYGHWTNDRTLYFTGIHRVNVPNTSTGMTLKLTGFDGHTKKIINPAGGIVLESSEGDTAASWSYPHLLDHWGRKHNQAIYVKYIRRAGSSVPEYSYEADVWLGQGTDFTLFLSALFDGTIVYDPGSRATIGDRGKTNVKARNQFRVGAKRLGVLYHDFEMVRL